MVKLKCIAIDDEPLALSLITEYASRFPALQLVQTFEDAISGAEYLKHHPADLLFIDIDMPDISGVDLVRALEKRPMIIFTTAYKQFAFEGFELEAVDYLLKPIDFGRFSKAVTRALSYREQETAPKSTPGDSIFVNSEYRQIRILLEEITYIESFEDYIEIHLTGGTSVSTLLSLKKVMEKLPQDAFKRIHRSYIIAVRQVKSVHNRKIELAAGKELPVGDSYFSSLKEWIR